MHSAAAADASKEEASSGGAGQVTDLVANGWQGVRSLS